MKDSRLKTACDSPGKMYLILKNRHAVKTNDTFPFKEDNPPIYQNSCQKRNKRKKLNIHRIKRGPPLFIST